MAKRKRKPEYFKHNNDLYQIVYDTTSDLPTDERPEDRKRKIELATTIIALITALITLITALIPATKSDGTQSVLVVVIVEAIFHTSDGIKIPPTLYITSSPNTDVTPPSPVPNITPQVTVTYQPNTHAFIIPNLTQTMTPAK